MFWKKETRFTLTDFENVGFVQCEKTKLWGLKEDMVKKTIIDRFWGDFGWRKCEKEVYFSPLFAPKWDIQDRTQTPWKCIKVVPEKQVEIKCDKSNEK